jgi:Ca2+-binding EF-hand superfamily protein
MDKNKDGYITKGELKLAKKNVGMKDIDSVIKQYDIDKDGKLNMDEFRKSSGK